MAQPKHVTAQTDFSAGEIDVDAKRALDNPLRKVGLRQCNNFRILDTGAIANRMGRRATLLEAGRTEIVQMAPGFRFFVCFGNSTLRVYGTEGTKLFDIGSMPWTSATVKDIVFAVYGRQIFIAFTAGAPQVLTWNGLFGFTLTGFAETVTAGGKKQTPFYRFATKGMTLTPSGTTGAITLTTSAAYFVAGMVGTRLRYQGRQLTITAVTGPTAANATVNETLLGGQQLPFAASPAFTVGDVVQGASSGATGQVTAVAAGTVDVTLLTDTIFLASEGVIGPTATGTMNAAPTAILPASVNWDEEVMNVFRGWPSSVFVDQNRLGLCNFPSLPSAILWSAVANLTNMYPGAAATDAILELAPNRSQVYFVMGGAESNEVVFTDNRIYYIPISQTNPLRPGSVAFNQIQTGGIERVEPRAVDEFIVYVESGGVKMSGLFVLGAYNRPFRTQSLTEANAHLFNDPIAIALPTANQGFHERYVYVLNGDGTLSVGKYSIANGQLVGIPGWVPWGGAALMTWVAAESGDVLMSSVYPVGATTVQIVEQVDVTYFLDGAITINPPPTPMQQPIPAGTNFGNLTGGGGLAAAFDGARSKVAASCAQFNNVNGFIGRNFTIAQTIGQALVWPSSDQGFTVGGSGPITIELRGSHVAPVSLGDGTLLASVVLADDQLTGPVMLNPVYGTTAWEYGFIAIARAGATTIVIAQILLQLGPLWWRPNSQIDLVDQGYRMMGTYTVDGNGNIIPQNLANEDLSRTTLVAGTRWTATAEPFIAPAPIGEDVGQRRWKRRVSAFTANVLDSTGFYFTRLFAGPLRPGGPALGAEMGMRRITAWNQDDDPTLPPPLREQAYVYRPLGRAHDPRVAIVKDTPGPLIILELTPETTV